MPSASLTQFMLLAVNIPAQEPQDGQALFSISVSSSKVILPAFNAPMPSKTEVKDSFWPFDEQPGSIAPPLINIVGIFTRAAPIIIPGTILSQLGIKTIPSKAWAKAIVS